MPSRTSRSIHPPRPKTKLARLLFERGLARKTLGQQLDPPVSVSGVSSWATGRHPLPEFRAQQIARLLGVDPSAVQEDVADEGGDAA